MTADQTIRNLRAKLVQAEWDKERAEKRLEDEATRFRNYRYAIAEIFGTDAIRSLEQVARKAA